MYPQKDNDCDEFSKSAGKSIDILVKLKSFKYPVVGNYWYTMETWTTSGIHGEHPDSAIEEWYSIPELGTGGKLC